MDQDQVDDLWIRYLEDCDIPLGVSLGDEPRYIDGSDTEFAVEAIAATIDAGILWPPILMSPEEAEKFEIKMPGPKKKFLWLGKSYSIASCYGWRVFMHPQRFEANTRDDSERITLFDDGTWSYGIW